MMLLRTRPMSFWRDILPGVAKGAIGAALIVKMHSPLREVQTKTTSPKQSDARDVQKINVDDQENKNLTEKSPLKSIRPPRHAELQYLDAVQQIISEGSLRNNRTGVDTKTIFGMQMRYSLRESFPLLTTKRVFWRGVVEELLWFIRGSINGKELTEKDVHIWDANSTREFLDKQGLHHREEGDLGPVYGFQWRHSGAEYKDMHADYTGQGVDQLAEVIDMIRNNPDSRRIIMCSWNPKDVPKMALPPCHCLVQFCVINGELSCQLYQRSADMGLGVPFNIASYSLLTLMIAHITGLKPGDFVHSIGDAHVYVSHFEPLQEQLRREPRPFPTVTIKRRVEKIEDFTFDDFDLQGYKPYPKIPMELAV